MFGFFSKKKPAKAKAAKPAKAAAKPAAKVPAPTEAKPARKGAPAPQPADPPVSAGTSLERAKSALDKRAGTADKQKLIQQALAVHQEQAKKLDRLPEETRNRLRAMALKAFVLGDSKDKTKLN